MKINTMEESCVKYGETAAVQDRLGSILFLNLRNRAVTLVQTIVNFGTLQGVINES